MPWLLLAGAIVLEIFATLSMKVSHGFTKKRWIIPVVLGYVGAFSLFAAVLAQGMAVGVAYGIWSAVGVALTAVLGRIVFKDPFTPLIALGVALAICGVLVIELGNAAS